MMKSFASSIRAFVLTLSYFFAILVAFLTPLLISQPAKADAPYLASDVLGQTDFVSKIDGVSDTLLDGPTGSFIDEINNRLFIGDNNNCRILIYELDNNNELIDKEADFVLGQPNFITKVCQPGQEHLNNPYGGLAYDNLNSLLFVSDYSNNRVVVYDFSTGISNGMNASYVLGQPDFVSQNLALAVNGLNQPAGLIYEDSTKYLYVADYANSRIIIYDLSLGITNGMDASWVLGQPDFVTGNSGGPSPSEMSWPWNISLDYERKYLFVGDGDCGSDRIMIFDLSGGITNGMDASWVLGQPDLNTSNYLLPMKNSTYCPVNGLSFDQKTKTLFVSDYDYRTLLFDLETITNHENAFFVLGQPDFESDFSQYPSIPTQGTYDSYYAANLAFDSGNKRLYFGDYNNNRVLIYDFANISLGSGDYDTPATIPEATFGVPYDYELPIEGTQGDVSCELTDGTLPQNVELTSDCKITGTPASNTVYNFTVQVSDDNGTAGTFTDSQVLALTVNHADSTDNLADTGDNPTYIKAIALILITLSGTVLIYKFYINKNKQFIKTGK
jgi:hypothetical protein